MAFVHRTTRELGPNVGAINKIVGPGSYDITSPQEKTYKAPLSYAPFSSSEERVISEGSGDFVPGPGTYNAGAVLFSQTAPVSSSQFISRVARLEEPKGTHIHAPGPGAYNHKKSWIKPGLKTRSKRNPGAVSWVRVPQAPSIPAPSQSFGYEENEHGELVPQAPLFKEVYTGLPSNSVGPGYYDPNPTKYYNREPAADFSKSKLHRDTSIKPDKAPGPGQYNPKPVEAKMRGPPKKLSVFVSNVERNNLVKGPDVPGPGAYEVKTTFAENMNPPQFQFFGSSQARFFQPSAGSVEPGPGSYECASGSFIKSNDDEDTLMTSKVGFGAVASRNISKNPPETDQERGPGSYLDLPNVSYELSRKVFGRCGSFGVTSRRFPKSKLPPGVNATPGPGTYTEKKLLHPPRKTSVFASKSNRLDEVTAKAPPPGPGSYSPFGFVSESSKYKEKQTSAFSNNQLRFGTVAETRSFVQAAHLGPGTYAIDVPTNGPGVSRFTTAKRFEEGPNGLEAPGPGAYIDPTYQLIKPTFNATIGSDFAR